METLLNIKNLAVFRVDASVVIGLGHVMRCLTVANKLASLGWSVIFICNNLLGHQSELIKENGHQVALINSLTKKTNTNINKDFTTDLDCTEDANQTIDILLGQTITLLVVDHYLLDEIWHKKLRPYVKKILVIDDLANRRYDCDILLDQTFNRSQKDYISLVNPGTVTYTGSKFALLREQFQLNSGAVLKHRLGIKTRDRILLMMGGSDPQNYTKKIMVSLLKTEGISITVLLGNNYLYLTEIAELCQQYTNITIKQDVKEVADIMLQHDICIGAAGSATWERCVCGLPTILISLADNQNKILTEMVDFGAAKYLQDITSSSEINHHLDGWRNSTDLYYRSVEKNIEICDGHGVNRIVGVIGV